MSEIIYVVEGWSGQYSDKYSWLDKAYRTKNEAKARAKYLLTICERAKKKADELRDRNWEEYDKFCEDFKDEHTYDPSRMYDPFFDVTPLELEDERE